jgi:hypothetical protein
MPWRALRIAVISDWASDTESALVAWTAIWLRLPYPAREFWTAEIGAMATSSAFWRPVLPLACSTPITVNWMLFSRTFLPTGSVALPKIDSAVVGPSTTTFRAAVTSSLVNSCPWASSWLVVVKYAGSVPATLEMS